MIRCVLAYCLVILLELCLPVARGQEAISGTVVDAKGREVEGATVWLVTNALIYSAESDVCDKITTQHDGRFELKIPEEWRARGFAYRRDGAVIAHHAGVGNAVAALAFNSPLPVPDLNLVLLRTKPIEVAVVAPDEEPVVAARVSVSALSLEWSLDASAKLQGVPVGANVVSYRRFVIALPEEIRTVFAAKTMADGVAIVGTPVDDVGGMRVESNRHGTQQFWSPPEAATQREEKPAKWPSRLKLSGTGRVTGRLISEPASEAAGVTLRIRTIQTNQAGFPTLSGSTAVTTDDAGRFDIPAIANGQLYLWAESDTLPDHRAGLAKWPSVEAGQKHELEIPWKRGIRVHGQVREATSGQPLSNVPVTVIGHGQGATITTDDQGLYESIVPPGQIGVSIYPHSQFMPEDRQAAMQRVQTLGADDDEVEVTPIVLRRWATVRGQVVDEVGRPVVGANVLAWWTGIKSSPDHKTFNREIVKTDAEGRFQIGAIDPDSEVRLVARNGAAFMNQPLAIAARVSDDRHLVVGESNAVALTGRVVDATGNPAGGIALQVARKPLGVHDTNAVVELVDFDGDEIRTDESGNFRTPKTIEPFGDYRVAARAETELEVASAWRDISEGTTFPDLEVASLALLEGVVTDPVGSPIRGARVTHLDARSTTGADTDARGRFRLDDCTRGTGFLLVQREGYHLFGQPLDDAETLSITLTPDDDPRPARAQAEKRELSMSERRALAISLIEPLLEADDDIRRLALKTLADIDPLRMLDELASNPFASGFENDIIRSPAVAQLARARPEDARPIIETIQTAFARAREYIRLADSLPEEKHGERLNLLAEALLIGRAEKSAAFRVHIFGLVGERLLDLGERAQATKILREGETIARGLSNAAFAGYSKGAFAEELAQIDLDAALELCADLADDSEFNRHISNIAHELAAVDPAAAERVLSMMKPDPKNYVIPPHDEKAVRVCYRMARVDLPRARRIADAIETLAMRAYAKGLMARSLVEADTAQRDMARQLLSEAFAVLEEASHREDEKPSLMCTPSTVGGFLLPVAKQVDPNRVEGYIWKTIALRRPVLADGDFATVAQTSAAELALLLARFDANVAGRVLDWIPEGGAPSRNRSLLPAKTLLRPQDAVDEVMSNQDDGRRAARLTVAHCLTLTGEPLDRAIHEWARLWYPDDEDLGL